MNPGLPRNDPWSKTWGQPGRRTTTGGPAEMQAAIDTDILSHVVLDIASATQCVQEQRRARRWKVTSAEDWEVPSSCEMG
jgi:hypothetical protein